MPGSTCPSAQRLQSRVSVNPTWSNVPIPHEKETRILLRSFPLLMLAMHLIQFSKYHVSQSCCRHYREHRTNRLRAGRQHIPGLENLPGPRLPPPPPRDFDLPLEADGGGQTLSSLPFSGAALPADGLEWGPCSTLSPGVPGSLGKPALPAGLPRAWGGGSQGCCQ